MNEESIKSAFNEVVGLNAELIELLSHRIRHLARSAKNQNHKPIQQESFKDLIKFIIEYPDMKYPTIELTNEGFLSTVWIESHNKTNLIVSIVFLGYGNIRYSAFPVINWWSRCDNKAMKLQKVLSIIKLSKLQNIVFKTGEKP